MALLRQSLRDSIKVLGEVTRNFFKPGWVKVLLAAVIFAAVTLVTKQEIPVEGTWVFYGFPYVFFAEGCNIAVCRSYIMWGFLFANLALWYAYACLIVFLVKSFKCSRVEGS